MNLKCETVLNLKSGTSLNLNCRILLKLKRGTIVSLKGGTILNIDCLTLLDLDCVSLWILILELFWIFIVKLFWTICTFWHKVTFLTLTSKFLLHTKNYPHKNVNTFNAINISPLKTLVFHAFREWIKISVTLNVLIEKFLHIYYFLIDKIAKTSCKNLWDNSIKHDLSNFSLKLLVLVL